MDDVTFIDLLAEKHAVSLPEFAEREELSIAWADARERSTSTKLRVSAAAIGLCTRIGRKSGASYAGCKCDVLVYGGRVYSWLREQGVKPSVIQTIGDELVFKVGRHLAVREEAVAEKVGFSKAGAEPST